MIKKPLHSVGKAHLVVFWSLGSSLWRTSFHGWNCSIEDIFIIIKNGVKSHVEAVKEIEEKFQERADHE